MPCAGKIHHSHPKCEHEDNPKKLNLQVFYNEQYNNFTGYCFSCGYHVGPEELSGEKKPKFKVKTDEEIRAEVQEVRELPTVPAKFRGIPAKFYAAWGVRQGVSEKDGKTPFAVYYGYTSGTSVIGWKVRQLAHKNFWSVGATKDADPFGWLSARKRAGKRIFITEGEQDAIALDYILQLYDGKNPKFKNRRHAIISLPNGVDSVTRTLKLVKHAGWKEIVLVMDNDGAGKKAISAAQKLLSNIQMVDMPMGCKDANDAAMAGPDSITVLAQNCLFNPHKPPIVGVVQVMDLIDKVKDRPVMGYSYPFPGLTDRTYGQRTAECAAWGAGVGLGKTLIAHEIAAHNATEHDINTFMVLLEEQNVDSIRNIAGKIDGIPYHKPDVEYSMDQLRSTVESLSNKILLWEDDGDQYLRFDMDEIIKAIRFNVAEFGTKFVTIDNMTRLIDHLNISEGNEFINKYSSELEALSTQLDIHIDVYSHLNAPYKGVSHEKGGSVEAYQFTGSRGLMRSFPMMFGFERNKHAEGALKSRSFISLVKSRKYGNEGKEKTQYFPATGKLIENQWEGDTIITKDKESK